VKKLVSSHASSSETSDSTLQAVPVTVTSPTQTQTTSSTSSSVASSVPNTMIVPSSVPKTPAFGTSVPASILLNSDRKAVVLEFDEEIVNFILEMGFSRENVLMCLIKMHEEGQSITLETVAQNVVKFNDLAREAELRKQLQETESKLKDLEFKLNSETEKSNELSRLQKQLHELEKTKKEKEEQISILTGGFGFEIYSKVHKTSGLEGDTPDSDCIVCMDNPKNYKTSCGCQVICKNCYKKLKKKECPFCGKPIK